MCKFRHGISIKAYIISKFKRASMGRFVLYYCFVICSLLLVLYGVGRFWVKPKRVERKLKQQGIAGRPYKLLIGDVKEFVRLITEAWSKPINLSHQIVQRVDPFTLDNVQKYRKLMPNLLKLHLLTL